MPNTAAAIAPSELLYTGSIQRQIDRAQRMLWLRNTLRDHAVMRAEKIRELDEINLRAEAAQRELAALCEEELRR